MIDQIADAAVNGSPVLVSAAGRLVGLGQTEREALVEGRIPKWLWMGAFLVGGFVIGVRVQKAWPSRMPRWVAGGKRAASGKKGK
jgi:hypothetical protein